MMVIFLVAIGAFLYYMFFNGNTPKGMLTFSGKESVEEQLKTRFVNGEIDEETYLRMKETIKG